MVSPPDRQDLHQPRT